MSARPDCRFPSAALRTALAGLIACLACVRSPIPAPPAPEPAAAPRPVLADSAPVRTPTRRPVANVTLALVGDVNLGTATLPDGLPPDSGRTLLAAARPVLTGDLVIANFEGVLADTGTSEKCRERPATHSVTRRAKRTRKPREVRPAVPRYAFRTPTHLAPRLREAGFTHLNLANNHANDYGPAGRSSTEAVLGALGLTTYGPLGRIAIDTVRRGDSLTTVGVLGFATYPHSYDLLDIPRSVAVVDSVRRLVDVLVVTFHGGAEGADALHVRPGAEFLGEEPRGDLRVWAHAVVDAGADVVVGHGPHVLRGMEFRRDRLIAYSLGNFATYRGFSVAGLLGITTVLRLELAGDGRFLRGRLDPMRQMPLQGPAPDPGGAALALVAELSRADFGPSGARVEPDGTILPPPAAP